MRICASTGPDRLSDGGGGLHLPHHERDHQLPDAADELVLLGALEALAVVLDDQELVVRHTRVADVVPGSQRGGDLAHGGAVDAVEPVEVQLELAVLGDVRDPARDLLDAAGVVHLFSLDRVDRTLAVYTWGTSLTI